jgi:hypothetical protein
MSVENEIVEAPKPIPGKRVWKADKRFSSGVLALGIIGGIFQFIAAIVGGLGWAFLDSMQTTFDSDASQGFLGLGADVTAGLILITGILASILAITGGAMNRGAPKGAFFMLWGSVVLACYSFSTILVLIAAIIHTIGVRRASGWGTPTTA